MAALVAVGAVLVLPGCATPQQPGESAKPEDDPLYDGRSPVSFERLLTSDEDADFERMGDVAMRNGETDKALYAWIRAAHKDPGNSGAFFKIGALHQSRGNAGLAAKAYQQVVAVEPGNIAALAELGMMRLQAREYERATELFQRAVAADEERAVAAPEQASSPDRSPMAKVFNGLGVVADLQSRHDEAIGYYERASAIRPNAASIRNNLGYSNYLSGNWTVAEIYYRTALSYDSKFERAWRNLALLYTRQKRFEDAILALTNVMSRAEASNSVGYLCTLQGDYAEADKFLRQAITLSPQYYELANQNLEKNRLLRSRETLAN